MNNQSVIVRALPQVRMCRVFNHSSFMLITDWFLAEQLIDIPGGFNEMRVLTDDRI